MWFDDETIKQRPALIDEKNTDKQHNCLTRTDR